jgi:hypothetical protein
VLLPAPPEPLLPALAAALAALAAAAAAALAACPPSPSPPVLLPLPVPAAPGGTSPSLRSSAGMKQRFGLLLMLPACMRNTNTGSRPPQAAGGQVGAAAAAPHLDGCSSYSEPPAPCLAVLSVGKLVGSSCQRQCKHLSGIPDCRVACRQGRLGAGRARLFKIRTGTAAVWTGPPPYTCTTHAYVVMNKARTAGGGPIFAPNHTSDRWYCRMGPRRPSAPALISAQLLWRNDQKQTGR